MKRDLKITRSMISREEPGYLIGRPRFWLVLLLLLTILALVPIIQTTAHPTMSRALEIFGLLVPIVAVSAAGDRGRHRYLALVLAGLCLLTSANSLVGVSGLPPQAGAIAGLAFLAYSTYRLFAGVMRSREVTGDVLAGALASYIMVGLTWTFAYGLLETLHPGSIRGLAQTGGEVEDFSSLLYFSYITQLTIGYGDITPATNAARTLAVLEGLAGMAFTTLILATLVAGYLRRRDHEGTGR